MRILQPLIICATLTLLLVNNIPAETIGDINNDGKVGLEETIYSLQVVAGIAPELGDEWDNLCVDEAAMSVSRPVDLIFVVDNSGSMSEESYALENTINTNLYQPLQDAGLDSRVVMVTNHGSGIGYDDNGLLTICVEPPLSGTTDCTGAPVAVPEQFYHYDVGVLSHDALCILLDTLLGSNSGGEADEWVIYPDGWVTALRSEALKVLIPMTDDGISCTWNDNTYNDGDAITDGQTVAVDWDGDFLPLAPDQFGTNSNRNYVMHAFVGIAENDPPEEPYNQFEPVTTAKCPGAVAPGTGYQWLSKGTGGLRFPVCNETDYDLYMSAIVDDTLAKTATECQYRLPEPAGQIIDPLKLRLNYSPTVGDPVIFEMVWDMTSCGTSTTGFYVSEDTIHLCPDTCTPVTDDATGTVQVEALCQ